MAARDDSLKDFERTTFSHGGETRAVFRTGSGPAVIVIAEMPGISPRVAAFARRVAAIGCTAVMPHLFGKPGRAPEGHGLVPDLVNFVTTLVPACISREFTVLATGQSSPVVTWLRALARSEHERCGGPGVGAIGMCFTGGYALAMATDDRLLAPVLAQPSMPLPVTGDRKRTIDISRAELDTVRQRCVSQGLQVLGLRFKGDRLVPVERFDFLRHELGDAFVAIELEDSDARQDSKMSPHSPLTEHLVDAPDSPTQRALDQVLDLFRKRLLSE